MRKRTIVRLIWDAWSAFFLLGFILALLWYINGSFEVAPTEEQQEKARMGAAILMIVTGAFCAACAAARIKIGKREKRKIKNGLDGIS